MRRWFAGSFMLAVLGLVIASGCGGPTEDAAAKWDGKDPLPPITIKPSKNKNALKEPPKRVRGFTVPKPK